MHYIILTWSLFNALHSRRAGGRPRKCLGPCSAPFPFPGNASSKIWWSREAAGGRDVRESLLNDAVPPLVMSYFSWYKNDTVHVILLGNEVCLYMVCRFSVVHVIMRRLGEVRTTGLVLASWRRFASHSKAFISSEKQNVVTIPKPAQLPSLN